MFFKEFRIRLDISQKTFAEKLGISPSALARYESLKIAPNVTLIQKYIDIFDANPNYLFLAQEPATLANIPKLEEQNINLLNDLNMILTQEQISEKLIQALIDEIIKKIDIGEYSKPSKLLWLLKLDDSKKARPFLFLYYIFNSIAADSNFNNQPNYMQYIIDTISDFKIMSLKNKAAFGDKIKNEVAAYIELNFKEEECKALVKNAPTTLKVLEGMMPPSMVLAHRKNI
ncbi:MAG: helix-turn-helix transcriptional regulator [Sulfurovaceae bacterium]